MSTLAAVAQVHAAATLFMVGVIWFVQVVHYPLFPHVTRDGFPRFQKEHESRTTWIVGPAMAAESLAAIALTVLGWPHLSHAALVTGLVLLGAIWLSTGLLQIPKHRILESGFDAAAHHFLTTSNWIRTTAWTARGALAFALLHEVSR
ncbi:MAG: hypothetical protein DHS20C21_11250 [Gemmatimonadota bacterium]|nr:MAG: hypothetical protein DHS20C21_11250 [Gemmatimonadota bacterium]